MLAVSRTTGSGRESTGPRTNCRWPYDLSESIIMSNEMIDYYTC